MSPIGSLIQLMRPLQWVKNSFVLVGLFFGHAWGDPVRQTQALLVCAAFCLLSSGVYVMNDLIDRPADRRHPVKRRRPLASGAIGVAAALTLMGVCLLGGCLLVLLSDTGAWWLFAAYVLLNVAYTLGLKHVVVLDVFIIAAGFMLRILAGTLGIGIPPSQWLLLCGLMLTLFLGFAKRRAELGEMGHGVMSANAASNHASSHRRVLEYYSPALLDQMMTVTTAGTIISYSLYTVSPETLALHGTTQLVYTVPLVIYGMFRYLFLLHRRGGGGDPAMQLLTDPHLLAAMLGWLALVAVILGR